MWTRSLILFGTFLALACSIPRVRSSQVISVPFSSQSIKYTGRVLMGPKCAQFDWSGIQLALGVMGTERIEIELFASNNTFDVYVDYEFRDIFNGTDQMSRFELVSGLDPSGAHQIRLVKRTEALFGVVCLVSLHLYGPAPQAFPMDLERPKMKIEFIGDSVTCGFGIHGPNPECEFSRETEDVTKTFAGVIAEEWDSEYMTIAWSGRGLIHNWGDQNYTSPDAMADLYPRTLANVDLSRENSWNFSSWVPDVVFIKLGANDYSVPPFVPKDLFVPAFIKFVQRIKLNYGNQSPKLSFVMPCGPTPQGPNNVLCDYIQEIVHILNNQLHIPAHYADINGILKMPDDFGCADHPNVVGHRIIAKKILEELNQIRKRLLA